MPEFPPPFREAAGHRRTEPAGSGTHISPMSVARAPRCRAAGLVLLAALTLIAFRPGEAQTRWILSIADASAPEGDAVSFTISLDNAYSSDLPIYWQTFDHTAVAPGDYTAQAETMVTIPAGATSTTINVPTVENTFAGGDKLFLVLIGYPPPGSPDGVFLDPLNSAGDGTIIDDDTPPAAPTGLTATLHQNTSNVELSWTAPADTGTLNGVAQAITGYQYRAAATAAGLASAAWTDTGRTEARYVVSGLAPGDWHFEVRAFNGVNNANGNPAPGAVSDRASATVTAWTFSIADASAPEGDAVSFTISLDHAYSSDLPIYWQTFDHTAVAPDDYTAQAETMVTIPAGHTSTTINVPTVENTVAGGDKVFRVLIGYPSGSPDGVFLDPLSSAGDGAIIDDDTPPAAPTGLTATFHQNTSNVELSWTAPADTGTLNGAAQAITGYQYRAATTAAGLASAGWTDTGRTEARHYVSGLAPGDWHFEVRAFNGVNNANGNPAPGAVSDPASATVTAGTTDRRVHRIGLFPAAARRMERGYQGFARIINRSDEAGEVRIEAFDDEGTRHGPVTLTIEAGEAAHFNSDDLEEGDADKGLSGGIGEGTGDWRLELASTFELRVLAYIRSDDGFLTSMHDVVPHVDGAYRVFFFNPGSNTSQVSRLRLINPGEATVEVTIEGIDDEDRSPGEAVVLEMAAGAARTLTAQQLESGEGLNGALGDGAGKWRLVVSAERPLEVMSLLTSPTGHLTNVSTAPGPMSSVEPGD